MRSDESSIEGAYRPSNVHRSRSLRRAGTNLKSRSKDILKKPAPRHIISEPETRRK